MRPRLLSWVVRRQEAEGAVSFDVFVQDLPPDARTVADIPDDFAPKPIGRRADIVAGILRAAPATSFAEPTWGVINGPGFSVEVNIGPEEVLTGFVAAAAEPGSVIYTDHWSGYNGLAGAGFQHWPTNISASGDPAHVAMPRVHRVASLLKRWLLGTHHGGVKPGQLDAYLQEFVFRFNRRTSRQRGLVFYRLLQQAVQVDPVPFGRLIARRS